MAQDAVDAKQAQDDADALAKQLAQDLEDGRLARQLSEDLNDAQRAEKAEAAKLAQELAERSEPPSDMNLLRERAEKLYKMETGKLDARESYYFNEVEQDGRHYKFSFGVLQKPSQVENFRDKLAQRDVSAGTGMHASHLTGDRFGAPGSAENLTPQEFLIST